MYETQTMNADLKGQVQTTGYFQVQPKNDKCCPHCGRCPHCGQPAPYNPYAIPTTYPIYPYTLTGAGSNIQGGISGAITGVTTFNAEHGG